MKSETKAKLAMAIGLLPFFSKKGSANKWNNISSVLKPLPSLEIQEKNASLLGYTSHIRSSLEARQNAIEAMVDGLLPSLIEGRFKDYKKLLEVVTDLNTGSFNRELKLSDVAIVKNNFPEADFWLQARGSDRTVGKVWRTYSNFPNEYGKAATSASKYDFGVKVKPEFLDSIDPKYLSYLFEYYHSKGVWRAYSYGSLNLVNIRISELKAFPIILSV